MPEVVGYREFVSVQGAQEMQASSVFQQDKQGSRLCFAEDLYR